MTNKTVHNLLLEAPDASVSTLQLAWKAAAAGDWMEVAKQLGYAAEHGDTPWHDECQALSDEFHAKAKEAS